MPQMSFLAGIFNTLTRFNTRSDSKFRAVLADTHTHTHTHTHMRARPDMRRSGLGILSPSPEFYRNVLKLLSFNISSAATPTDPSMHPKCGGLSIFTIPD